MARQRTRKPHRLPGAAARTVAVGALALAALAAAADPEAGATSPRPEAAPEARTAFEEGEALRDRGRIAEALEAFERALASDPDAIEARVELALLLGRVGRVEEAKRHFGRALAQDPEHVDARVGLAVAYLKEGKPRYALRELDRVLKRHPDHAAARGYRDAARASLPPPAKR